MSFYTQAYKEEVLLKLYIHKSPGDLIKNADSDSVGLGEGG